MTGQEIRECAKFLRNCTDAQVEHMRTNASVDEQRALAEIEVTHRENMNALLHRYNEEER